MTTYVSLHFGMHDYLSAPKPECLSDPECPNHLACIQEKCQNPCFTHSCGQNAECKVKNHRALCVCLYGFVGDPYTLCEERKEYIQCGFYKNRYILH